MIVPSVAVSPRDIADHYNSLGSFYLDTWGDSLHHGYWKTGDETAEVALANLRDHVADLVRMKPGDSVCDVGCGYGAAAIHWTRTRQSQITGITIAKCQFEKAEKDASSLDDALPQPRFLCSDWLENRLSDSSFDSVVSIECFSHVGDKEKFLQEVQRVLRPGGAFAMTAWMARENPSSLAVRHLLKPICYEGRFTGLVNRSELETLLSGSGLELESLVNIGPNVKKTWRVILARLAWRVLSRHDYRKFLIQTLKSDRRLAFTVLRVWLAFETGQLEYAIVKAAKPLDD